jgi:SAM-dependent methyltransferase
MTADAAARIRALAPDERHLFVGDDGDASLAMALRHAKAYERAAPEAAGKTVLDLGCGSGSGSVYLSHLAKVTAFDVDPRLVALLPTVWPDAAVTWCQGGTDRLPFDAAAFDLVTSFQVIEHVPVIQRYLAEIQRVLRPGGRVLITTPNRLLRLGPFQKPWNPYHVRELASWQLRSELRQSGFENVEILGLQGRPSLTNPERVRTLKLMAGPYWSLVPEFLRRQRRRGEAARAPEGAANAVPAERPALDGYWWSASRLYYALDLLASARKPA